MNGEKPDIGLGDYWEEIEESLRTLIECYEKVNKVISWGNIGRLRRKAIRIADVSSKKVLDAGCGPGYMGAEALRQGANKVYFLDPLPEMLAEIPKTLRGIRGEYERVMGIFEKLPFRNYSIERVVAGFSLRDAYDLEAAVKEISRILVPDGKVVILDFYRPDNRIHAALIEAYLRWGVPSLALLAGCRKAGLYVGLYKTYRRHLTGSQYKKLFERYFKNVKINVLMGSVMLLEASHPLVS